VGRRGRHVGARFTWPREEGRALKRIRKELSDDVARGLTCSNRVQGPLGREAGWRAPLAACAGARSKRDRGRAASRELVVAGLRILFWRGTGTHEAATCDQWEDSWLWMNPCATCDPRIYILFSLFF